MIIKTLIIDEFNLHTNIDKKFEKIIFPWDEQYFKKQSYSLKQLVFIYECIIDLESVEIIQSDINGILNEEKNNSDFYLSVNDLSRVNKDLKYKTYREEISLLSAEGDKFFKFWDSAKKILARG